MYNQIEMDTNSGAFDRDVRSKADRRGKARISCACPARVHGYDLKGVKFEAEAVLANISTSGLYLRMREAVRQNDCLVVYTSLAKAIPGIECCPRIAAQGKVVRLENLPDGTFGVAIQLSQYRLC